MLQGDKNIVTEGCGKMKNYGETTRHPLLVDFNLFKPDMEELKCHVIVMFDLL